jgi:hypothetical protein
VRSVWVASLRTRILALGSAAPDVSVTVPESDEVSDWALAEMQNPKAHAAIRNDARRKNGFIRCKTKPPVIKLWSKQTQGKGKRNSQSVKFGLQHVAACPT